MATPFFGKRFTFTQPDGTQLEVRGWGNQHQATFETLDGFTVVEDPASGFYEYATLDQEAQDLLPTGATAGITNPSLLGLSRKIRISKSAARAKGMVGDGLPATPSRWQTRREQARLALKARAAGATVTAAPPQRKTVGQFVGLCLLIDFPDVPATITREEVEAFCNEEGYTGFGNNGSVKDYFRDNSGGKLLYTNVVVDYYTARERRSYYTNESIPQPRRAIELIKEALADLKTRGFDFSVLTSDAEDYVYAINVFYAGPAVNNWAKGLWPHSHHLAAPLELTPGKLAYDYQFTNMGSELALGTFCHENGHMICDFPDLYDYDYDSKGVGAYCLMCGGANADEKNPTRIGAYLRHAAGWADRVVNVTPGNTVDLRADRNEFATWRNGSSEYFILENRLQNGRDSALPDQGLAIWHVDELGNNSNQQMTPARHYECSLVQADNQFDLEGGRNDGAPGDLFSESGNAEFSDTSMPSCKWWDGSVSGVRIREIGPVGPVISFKVY